ncbi:MAG: GNAT family N-acetyltransferase [Sphingopyxis solisilvae]|uniref:GNAT family N-acetyltransferase n=1 Tax=Sphingopyxis solisilvae TaxID=1886788 RepID=UPI0040375BBE
MIGADGTVTLRVELAGRRFGSIRRKLAIVPHPLDLVLANRLAPVPAPARDGYLFTSVPAARVGELKSILSDHLVMVRQTFARHYVPMEGRSFDDWWLGFSGKTRSGLTRKARRLERELGTVTVLAYRTPTEVREFMTIAGGLSERTYQARLLQAGLPGGGAAIEKATGLAAADNIRCFILFAAGRPLAYLYLPVEDDVVVYGFVGYDPDHAALSPGNILQVEVMRALFAEGRFRYFDFTGGDGAHKAHFGRGAVACADVIALRRTLRNRVALGVLQSVDATARRGKRLIAHIQRVRGN